MFSHNCGWFRGSKCLHRQCESVQDEDTAETPHQTTHHHIPEDLSLQQHSCDNLISCRYHIATFSKLYCTCFCPSGTYFFILTPAAGYSQQYPKGSIMPHYVAVMWRPHFQNLYGSWQWLLVLHGQLQQLAYVFLVAGEGQTQTQQNPACLQQGIVFVFLEYTCLALQGL
jgi:hypothetical protein